MGYDILLGSIGLALVLVAKYVRDVVVVLHEIRDEMRKPG